MKFFPTVEEIADMSPICSIIVAKEIGRIVITDVSSRPRSACPLARRPNTVSFQMTGEPIHAAFATGAKSTLPVSAATR